MTTLEERLVALEVEIGRLKNELRTEREQQHSVSRRQRQPDSSRAGPSRRSLVKAGAAAVVAAAATPLVAGTAHATDGAALIVGQVNSSASGTSRLQANAGGVLSDNVFTAADGGSGSQFPSAIGGFGFNNRVSNGVYAFSGGRTDGTQGTGHAMIARPSSASRSHLYMIPISGDPRTDTYVHGAGEFRADASGQLWFCVEAGTPGKWRRLAGAATAGAMHAIEPTRVYDSRFVDGHLAGGSSRTISVANGIDILTGASNAPDLVPTGATAVAVNLVAIGTVAAGFLTVTPGDATSFKAASINWASSGLTLNNGTQSTLDGQRRLTIWAGGGGANFHVDITGYYL